jgi:hypothetical protein
MSLIIAFRILKKNAIVLNFVELLNQEHKFETLFWFFLSNNFQMYFIPIEMPTIVKVTCISTKKKKEIKLYVRCVPMRMFIFHSCEEFWDRRFATHQTELYPFLGYLKYYMDKPLTSVSITLSCGCSLFADQMHKLNFFL